MEKIADYFIFLAPNDIRIQGTRVGIETILYDYIYREKSPEAIAKTYSSLRIEQVYATILYYLQNQKQVSQYIADWLEWGHQMRAEQKRNPPAISEKISQLRKERLLSGKSYANQIFDG
ncbi:MAG: DUF433 domain-containing protein [Okeania sp. SIO2H7]|nr:DUF433 domain-containing protein [Okeania sp. SIO2H7]